MVLIVWKVGEVLCATKTRKSSCEEEVGFQARLIVTSKSVWQLSSACLGYKEDWLWFNNDDKDGGWSNKRRKTI